MTKPTFKTEEGLPLPLGPTTKPEGVNFALFSRNATEVSLLFFATAQEKPVAEIKLDPKINRTGDIWHILVCDLDPALRYGYCLDGPFDPMGAGHYFSKKNILIDPYAKALTGGTNWGVPYHRQGLTDPISTFQRRCCIVENHFDWEGDRPLNIPLQDTIIYEMHIRGFTQHRSSGVAHPGTYQGIIEKIPYLRQLGITAVELLPVTEFNEHENIHHNPATGESLKNFWGYSPISFFAPKAAYAVNGRNGNQVREFKEMVKALHKAGIEVILDVVVNHTAEGGSDGPIISFRGLENTIYYLLDPKTRDFLNFSGCGNTVNCNHPLVRHLIMDCLRYWVMEMHVDGFRFDLASVLGRDQQGNVLSNPPMVEKIAEDPILAHTKIIAEAWDAAGLYQVGSFSTHHRWAEWNGKYRDDVRRFVCGQENTIANLATRLAGSADLYQDTGRKPYNSINFITSHDGFTLYDLVSYNEKHNEQNGELSRDGDNFNISWNSGCEGDTTDPAIIALRKRRIRTFATILFISQGPPMFVAGDEFGRSQLGNNNAYCQDNEISWLNWELAETNQDLLLFFKGLIALRKKHSVFRRLDFFAKEKQPEIEWFSRHGATQDWQPHNKTLGLMLHGRRKKMTDDDFYILFNGHHTDRTFIIPAAPKGRTWRQIVNSGEASPANICAEEKATAIAGNIKVAGLAAVILIAKP
ncbi:MAG: glycogen debranching protein GlgX [Desulfobulbaceae bacterium]|nr:glycogen debranching protein GlgX [Desulfobulbaceae bacterium]HIJ78581.1 glycogen debranching protein GlgX [Deltaproteobacteria bacterium]